MKRIVITFAAVISMIGGVWWFLNARSTNSAQPVHAENQLKVVTTNSILEDMVHQVGQERVELSSIVKRGTDPHEYEPRPSDVAAAIEADVLFHNGLNLETGGSGWFNKLVITANKKFNREVFAASEGIAAEHLTTNVKEVDPHAWLDLANGMQYVRTITKVLKTKDPANAAFYQQNADRYLAKLAKLHRSGQKQFQDIPENQRLLVTSEGAFKYFSKAYGLTPAYIWEINTEAQGTPEQMQQVLGKVAASQVKAVFVETSVSPKAMEKVAQDSGLKIYSKLYTDSLAQAGQPGATYYGMMAWNLKQIHAGLAGTAE